MKVYNKLVRDNIPKIIEADGKKPQPGVKNPA
jgi:predicted house-cleaning noncanonical NTP pyrophosphatase (MazG superfamily)